MSAFLKGEQDAQENMWSYKEVAVYCGKLHDEELHNLYPLTNNIKVLKSMRMRLVGHVACLRNRKGK
jgi:hypothetical protein